MKTLKKTNNLTKTLAQYIQLVGSTALTIVMQFIGIKLFTYLLPPSIYGDYRLVTNLLQFLQILIILGIPFTVAYVIVDPKLHKEEVKDVISAGNCLLFISTIAFFLIISLLFFLQNILGSQLLNLSWLIYYFFAIAIILQYYFDYVLMGLNEIKHIAIKNIVTQIIQISLLMVALLLGTTIGFKLNLLWSLLIFSLGNMAYPLFLLHFFKVPVIPKKQGIAKLFKTNLKVGIPVYFGSILSVASTYVVNIIVRLYSSSFYYAQFGLAVQIASPLGILLTSIGSVFFKKFREDKIINKKFMKLIVFMTVGIATLYVITVPILIPFLFGNNYKGAIIYAQLIGVGALLVGFADIINRFLSSKGMSKLVRNAAITSGISNLVLAYFLLPRLDLLGASLASIGSNIAYLLAMLIAYFYYLKHLEKVNS